jgi:heme exporter protein D
MNWGNLDNFLHMGGNGLYVWGSYAVTGLLMLLEPALAARRRRQAMRDAHDTRQDAE